MPTVLVAVLACAVAGPFGLASASAQTGAAGAADTSPMCFVRTVDASSNPDTLGVVAQSRDAGVLGHAGYVATVCEPGVITNTARLAWRDRVCALAANPSVAMQAQFELLLGLRTNVLCGMAERVLGPWQKPATGASE
jgi:hypothetical protein